MCSKLAADFLSHPVKVTIGSQELSASHSVTQVRGQQPLIHSSGAPDTDRHTPAVSCPLLS